MADQSNLRNREPGAPLVGSSIPTNEARPARRALARALFVMVVMGIAYLACYGQVHTRPATEATESLTQAYVPSGSPTETTQARAQPSIVATLAVAAPAAPTPRPHANSSPNRIRIPRIDVDAPVVEVTANIREENGESVTVWQVADFAAGFHLTSAYPGHIGNTVISAHNNIHGRVFRHLVDLVPGDDVYLYADHQEYQYVVTQCILVKEKGAPEEIRRDNAEWIQPTTDERLTLVSCWPFIKPDHRVVVVARPNAR